MNRAKSFSPWGKNQWLLKFWLAGPQHITQHLAFAQQVDLKRRLFRVPWTARRSNQSILKEISPEYSLKGLMLKLKFQYFGHLMQRADSLQKTLMLGTIKGSKRRMTEDEMVGWHHWLNGHEFEQAPGVGDGQGSLACCSSWGRKESDTTEWLNWNELVNRSEILNIYIKKKRWVKWKERNMVGRSTKKRK